MTGRMRNAIAICGHCGYNRDMVRVKIRELKDRLSYYLRLVRGGETVVILDRDRTIAEIRARESDSSEDAVARYLDGLSVRGLLAQGTQRKAESATEVTRAASRERVKPDWRAAYAAEREDRLR